MKIYSHHFQATEQPNKHIHSRRLQAVEQGATNLFAAKIF